MPCARWFVRLSALVAAVALIAGGRVPLNAAQSPVAVRENLWRNSPRGKEKGKASATGPEPSMMSA